MKINTEKKIYYSVCSTIVFLLAVIMIYREIPHGNTDSEKELINELIPQSVTAETTNIHVISESDITAEKISQTCSVSEPQSLPVTPETEQIDSGLIDLNTADIKTLMSLKGIGEKKAQNIIDYRESSGGFRSTDELVSVPGIGKKTAEAIKNLVTVTAR